MSGSLAKIASSRHYSKSGNCSEDFQNEIKGNKEEKKILPLSNAEDDKEAKKTSVEPSVSNCFFFVCSCSIG